MPMLSDHSESNDQQRAPRTGPRTILINVYTAPKRAVVAHGGDGLVNVVRPFVEGDFETELMFIDYVEMPPGSSIGKHRHGDDEEVYFILESSGLMSIDGREHRVSAGDLILNVCGGEHGLSNDGEATLKLLVWQVKHSSKEGAVAAATPDTESRSVDAIRSDL
jgi:quercetin dioxygenase-like cupin family protein